MLPETITSPLSFEILTNAIAALDLERAKILREILDEAIADLEEDLLEESDREIQAEIAVAKKEYAAGDYITLDEYTRKRAEKLL